MIYESDFSYFMKQPRLGSFNQASDNDFSNKISFDTNTRNKCNDNNIYFVHKGLLVNSKIDDSKRNIDGNKIAVININEHFPTTKIEKKQNYVANIGMIRDPAIKLKKGIIQQQLNDENKIKRAAVKWATKASIKKSLINLFERYCDQTSVHGIKYLAQKNQHWCER